MDNIVYLSLSTSDTICIKLVLPGGVITSTSGMVLLWPVL